MNCIFVTGGAGFIGSNFVRQGIGESDARFINFDKLTYAGNLDSLRSILHHPRHVFEQGDIGDVGRVRQMLQTHQPMAVVNFAAESHVDRSIDGPREFMETNVMGTFGLLEAIREYWGELSSKSQQQFRLLHVSTDEVFGSLGDEGRFTETTPYAPNSPYAASKASSDHLVRSYHHTFGIPTIVSNCSNNYGPYQFPEKLVPLMILNAVSGKPLPIYGDGKNVRDWLYVEDHCRALRMVLERGTPGETYNIGGDCELTNKKMVQAICGTVDRLIPGLAHAPCNSLITYVKDRPGHDHRYAIDSGKLQHELGWRPSTSFESGLEKTVRWYLDNADWKERVTSGSYRGERLGLEVGA